MKTIRNAFYMIVSSLLLCAGSAFAQAPTIFFTDITSGPSTGGEGGNGALVTLYGNNFSLNPVTSIGGQTAPIKAGPSNYLWYQKLTVQVPSSVALGATNISVSNASGSSNSIPFTVRAGTIVMVTSAAQLKAVRSTWKAGDIYYLQGTWSLSGDDGNGWRSSFSIFGPTGQNYAQGTVDAPIAIVGYPGSNVTIGGGADYGIRGDRSYVTFANVSLRGTITSANPTWSNGLRYIANDISASTTHVQMGCWSSNSVTDVKFLGNNVHNCGTSSSDKQDHSVYFSTDVNHVEEAWNSIHDNQTCYGTQFHSSPITSGTGNNQFDLHVHDNLIYNQYCSAINFATIDPSKGTVEMYNNLVYHVGYSIATDGGVASCLYVPGYTNAGSVGSGTVQVYNNTFSDCGPAVITINDASHKVSMTNNISQMNSTGYLVGSNVGQVSGTNNLWFGAGNGPSQTTGNINANPLFVAASTKDFHLATGSPALDAGLKMGTSFGMNLGTGGSVDMDGQPRQMGNSIDLGAFEFGGPVTKPDPPQSLDAIVQ